MNRRGGFPQTKVCPAMWGAGVAWGGNRAPTHIRHPTARTNKTPTATRTVWVPRAPHNTDLQDGHQVLLEHGPGQCDVVLAVHVLISEHLGLFKGGGVRVCGVLDPHLPIQHLQRRSEAEGGTAGPDSRSAGTRHRAFTRLWRQGIQIAYRILGLIHR